MTTKPTQTATRNVQRSSQTERILDVIKNDIRPTSRFQTDERIERTIAKFESLLDKRSWKEIPQIADYDGYMLTAADYRNLLCFVTWYQVYTRNYESRYPYFGALLTSPYKKRDSLLLLLKSITESIIDDDLRKFFIDQRFEDEGTALNKDEILNPNQAGQVFIRNSIKLLHENPILKSSNHPYEQFKQN